MFKLEDEVFTFKFEFREETYRIKELTLGQSAKVEAMIRNGEISGNQANIEMLVEAGLDRKIAESMTLSQVQKLTEALTAEKKK